MEWLYSKWELSFETISGFFVSCYESANPDEEDQTFKLQTPAVETILKLRFLRIKEWNKN
jgi:hypothetical protein